MAIQFRCPHCDAVVRVADAAAGQVGTCPRCQQKLRVPIVQIPTSRDINTEQTIPTEVTADVIPSIRPVERPLSRELRQRRSAGAAGIVRWLVPLLCGGLLLSGAAWFFQEPAVNLTGILPGEVVTSPATLRTTIPASISQTPTATTLAVIDDLTSEPILVKTELMEFELGGGADGFMTQVRAGVTTELVRVDARADPTFATECARLADVLERLRSEDQVQAMTEFVNGWAALGEREERVSHVAASRKSFGLTSLVRGPGHQLVALVDQTIYPCVAEDADGTMSFLIPQGTTDFAVVDRTDREGESPFRVPRALFGSPLSRA